MESPYVIVQTVVYDALWPDFPLGDALELSSAREGPERFISEVRSDAEVRPTATTSMTLPAADLPRSAPFASTSGACARD